MFYLANGMEEAHPGVSQLSCVGTGCSQRSNFKSVRWHKLLELRNNFQNFINMVCSLLSTSSEILLPEMGPIWSDFPFLSPFSYMLIWLDNIYYSFPGSQAPKLIMYFYVFLSCLRLQQARPPVGVSVTYLDHPWAPLEFHSNGRWCFICFPCTLW